MDREGTVEKACQLIQEASTNGADLVVFPEVYVPGYCHWLHYYPAGHPVSLRLNRELFKNAVGIPSPTTDRLCEAARRANAYVVMGLNERRPGMMPGTLYSTMLFIHRNGAIMGKHQKLMPTFKGKSGYTSTTLWDICRCLYNWVEARCPAQRWPESRQAFPAGRVPRR
ncbi:MAG: nitrilase-related carbon-nitrogen hydrolase [Candidatus Binatia bacterium]